MSLETNYSKAELAEKVRELTKKLTEMKQVESQINASTETLKDGNPAVGIVKNKDGTFTIVKLVYDLEKNAAVIIGTEALGRDMQVAGGTLMKRTGDAFYKAAGIKI